MAEPTAALESEQRPSWWRSIGPALITACVVFGPGSLLISANIGASHRYQLLWLLMLTGILMVVLFLWPWIDRRLERLAPGKNLPIWLGVFAFLVFLTFTVWEAMVP